MGGFSSEASRVSFQECKSALFVFGPPKFLEKPLRGSGYLGSVDSNQGYNPYKWIICPLTRVINLHITSYQVS